ncbi:hypothetical protein N9S30_00290 [bacterium]|nr:hypothetical protein [bacterium]
MDNIVISCPVDLYGLLAAVDLVVSSKAVSVEEANVKKKKSTIITHPTITVSPIHVDLPLAHNWLSALRRGAEVPLEQFGSLDRLIRVVSCSGKHGGCGEAWRDRLLHEADRVNTLLTAMGECDQLDGVVFSNEDGGRLKVYYPMLSQVDFFKSISGPSRHVLTAHSLLELDISGAHPAAAFAAVVALCDGDREQARVLTPKLALVVEDREAAVGILSSQYGAGEITDADCKVKILRSLNQSHRDETHSMRKPYLKALVKERKIMTNALLEFAPIGNYVDAIRDKAMQSNKDTTLLSLLMQAVEQQIIEAGIDALDRLGWAFVVPISDAVLVRATTPELFNPGACERARCAMQHAARGLLGGLEVKIKIEHAPLF